MMRERQHHHHQTHHRHQQGGVGVGDGGGGGGAPHGILLLAAVIAIVVVGPFLFGDQVTEAFSELLSPFGLILLPILLLLAIQFLSSDRASFLSAIFSSTGEPDTIHRLSGSPIGVALFLLLILILLYNRVSIFSDDDDDSGEW